MKNKLKCDCGLPAVWYYIPSDNCGAYCDSCVSRGCSCNLYENEVGETVENKDELGRLLPCCEYMYNEKGFDDLDEINTII